MKKQIAIGKQAFILLLVCLPMAISAQIKVEGNVSDTQDEPLPGVSVVMKGTNDGTISDIDGNFEITVRTESDILVFSAMSFQTKEVQVTKGRPMKVTLEEDTWLLDEIVVVGYRDMRKSDLTGSIARADMSDILQAPVTSVDEALGGRIAGVHVTSDEGSPGSPMNIVIRGNNSLTQENSPLYIIDGFPVENPSATMFISPNDIESIDVLKDASATAIYGSRGANGVIIIQTKQGDVGPLRIRYDFSFGVQRITKRIPVMDAYEFVRLQEEVWSSVEMYDPYGGYFATIGGKSYRLDDYRNIAQYDWQDMIFRDAARQNHSLSVTGGSGKYRYNASFSYNDQDGIVLNSNFNRLQGRVRNTYQEKNLKIDVSTSFSHSTKSGMNPSSSSTSGMNNLFYSVWGYRPVTQPALPLTSLLDNITDESVNQTSDYRFNPILSLNNEYRKNRVDYSQHNAFAEYEFSKGLKLKVSGTLTTDRRRTEIFNNSKTRGGSPYSTNKVNATLEQDQRYTWLNENILTYQTTVEADHSISALAGLTFQELENKYSSVMTKNIPNESLGMAGMGYGDPGQIRTSKSEWSLMSYLGRINYHYRSTYYLTASLRMDGSSKFRKNNRWGYFPSFSGAWTFTKEDWMKALSKIWNEGKIRASWGQTGNNRVGYYDSYSTLRILTSGERDYTSPTGVTHGVYPFNNDVNSIGAIPYNLPNKNLKWETTTQTNIGVDLSFLKGRTTLTVDWYKKVTSDLLLRASLVPSSGYGSAMMNIGKVENQGLEVTLKANVLKKKNFSWDAKFNIAFNRNKVLGLAENQEALLSTAHFDQNFVSPNYIAKKGYPMSMMYGYIYEGTYKVSDFDRSGVVYSLKPGIPYYTSENNTQPGYPNYADLNGDGIIDSNDQTIIGKGTPVHIGGFTHNFKYKRFDLNLFFQWSYGGDIINANRLMFESSFSKRKDLNQFASYKDRWTFDNQHSDIPRVNASPSSLVFSSRVIEDGSFIRLKTVSFGYNFSSKLIKKYGFQEARFVVSAQNLLTMTRYSGYDPEVSVRNTPLTPGLDFSAYPRAKTFNIGINLTL